MLARARTVAFEGVEARIVETQCVLSPGLPSFQLVGLPDKAVSEARERVRAALSSLSIALPPKRITVNLSPADMPKEGSHFDLPIALALLAALELIPAEELERSVSLGELALDGALVPVVGALPAAMAAASGGSDADLPRGLRRRGRLGRRRAGLRAAHAPGGDQPLHRRTPLARAKPGEVRTGARRAICATSRARNAPSARWRSRRRGGITCSSSARRGRASRCWRRACPASCRRWTPAEALETSMIHSLAGLLDEGGISRARPFREPHHTASVAAIVGGGRGAKPGEISLAHNGVLFMDEFPEYPRTVLETLRQPIETGEVVVARANAHTRYPCRFLLIAAANPCKCGYMAEPARACARVPQCGEDYLGRISGPLMDRFDLRVEVPPVAFSDLDLPASGDSSAEVAARVAHARARAGRALRRPRRAARQCRCRGRASGRDRHPRQPRGARC
jgi:magnesium chelatase family protein